MANGTALALRGHGAVPQSKTKLTKGYISLKRSLATHKEKIRETTEGMVRTTEVAGAAFALGAIQGVRAGKGEKPYKFFGKVNLELGVAGVLYTAGIFGLAGDYSSHLKNFADGSLAAFTANWGRGIGYKWAKEKKEEKGGAGGDLEDQIAAFLQ